MLPRSIIWVLSRERRAILIAMHGSLCLRNLYSLTFFQREYKLDLLLSIDIMVRSYHQTVANLNPREVGTYPMTFTFRTIPSPCQVPLTYPHTQLSISCTNVSDTPAPVPSDALFERLIYACICIAKMTSVPFQTEHKCAMRLEGVCTQTCPENLDIPL